MIKNIPSLIYLQVGDSDADDDVKFDDLTGVTWNKERIYESDLVYKIMNNDHHKGFLNPDWVDKTLKAEMLGKLKRLSKSFSIPKKEYKFIKKMIKAGLVRNIEYQTRGQGMSTLTISFSDMVYE